MPKELIGKKDTTILREIVAALGQVGSELDAADKVRGHSPWSGISRQGTRIVGLAKRLSDRFRSAHPDLVQRLVACENLHLAWGSLQDEVEQVIRKVYGMPGW